jgi:methionyl-tRNA formyltransferase
MKKMRVGLVYLNDYYFSLKLLQEMEKQLGERLVFVGEVTHLRTGRQSFDKKLREIATLLLLYGWMGIFRSLWNRLFYHRKKQNCRYTFLKTSSPSLPTFIQALKDAQLDVIIHQSPHKLNKEFLSIPSLGVWNRHCGAVPQFRGQYTPFWAWFLGKKTIGLSILKVEEGYDDGGILAMKEEDITAFRTVSQVLDRAMERSNQLLAETILSQEKENISKRSQGSDGACYFSIPSWKDLGKALQYLWGQDRYKEQRNA